jgi:hypothetical protein
LATGLLILFSATLLNGQVNLTQSLTACYTLDGNGTEPINNLTATLSAVTPTLDRFNNASSAMQFNGTPSSQILLPNNPLLKPTNAFSFSCWIKTSQIANQYILMTRNPATSNFETYCLHILNLSGQLRIRSKKCDSNNNAVLITGTTSINANSWNHFVVTIDNTEMRLYTNGVLDAVGTTTFSFDYLSNKNIVLGGSNEASFNMPFTGTMDNLRFYNRILNTQEISMLYTADPTCNSVSSVASHDASKTDLIIFPNPSKDTFSIKTDGEITEVKVFDILGNFILNVNNETQIDISDKPCGIYIVKVKINGVDVNYKIMKE